MGSQNDTGLRKRQGWVSREIFRRGMAVIRKRARLANGQRIYAVGDIHGRLDLFAALMAKIRVDAARQRARRTKLILLGDLIDRGPNSREVVDHVQRLAERSDNLIVLRGNHEEVMVRALNGDKRIFDAWLQMGGTETLKSWGITQSALQGPLDEVFAMTRRMVPQATIDWMRKLPLFYRSGGILFVHAGIRPEVALREQNPTDFLWIRSDFINSDAEHPALIVHGHTVCEHGPEMLWNRINVDTGAYRTNRLSAVGFQGARQWTLSTSSEPPNGNKLTHASQAIAQ